MKAGRAAGFKNVARIDFGEALVVNAQDFSIALVVDSRRQTQLVLEIESPADDALGIFADQCSFAG